MSFPTPFTSAATLSSVASSPSSRASEKSSVESARLASIFSTVATISSRMRRSLPSSCAFFESDQTFGSSSAFATSTSRDFFAS
jgi:hypothetical protein